MIEPIYLSHLHEESPVFIPKYIASFLANYHIIGVRFLYDAFIKKVNIFLQNKNNVLLN